MAKKKLDFLEKAKMASKGNTDLTEKTESALNESNVKKRPSEKGLKTGYTRFSFVVNKNNLELLKAIVWYERKETKDVMEEALETLFKGRDTDKILKAYRESK